MNGIIKTKQVSAPDFDEDGNPTGADASFVNGIPCKYVSANRNDVFDIGGGIFVQASYIITVRDMDFASKQIQLTNSRNELICELDVKSLEVLESIKRVKIIV